MVGSAIQGGASVPFVGLNSSSGENGSKSASVRGCKSSTMLAKRASSDNPAASPATTPKRSRGRAPMPNSDADVRTRLPNHGAPVAPGVAV